MHSLKSIFILSGLEIAAVFDFFYPCWETIYCVWVSALNSTIVFNVVDSFFSNVQKHIQRGVEKDRHGQGIVETVTEVNDRCD